MRTRARGRDALGAPRAASRALLLAAAAALVWLVSGCGAPEYTYVTNSAEKTYVKLPTTWRQIDKKALDDAIGLDPAL